MDCCWGGPPTHRRVWHPSAFANGDDQGVLQDLSNALTEYFETRPAGTGDALNAEIVRALRDGDDQAAEPTTTDAPPVTRWLSQLVTSPDPRAQAVTDAFAAIALAVPWRQTRAYLDAMPADTASDYGYVAVLGPSSLIEADSVAIGIGLWAPGLHYPMHHHAAEEAYHVLAGRPEFRTPSSEWRSLSVGDSFHQPSWAPHEQRFNDEPCLLMWAWGGSVADPAHLVDG